MVNRYTIAVRSIFTFTVKKRKFEIRLFYSFK